MKPIDHSQYKEFFKEIKEKIYKSQYEALKQVNKELMGLYWEIGRLIVERQEKYEWGKSVVENLVKDLQSEFAGVQGFSTANLWRMKKFYEVYHINEKLAPLVREISWSHNVVIMEKCKDEQEKVFYIQMSKKFGWSRNVLVHQIEGKSYEKYLLNQTNFDQAVPEKYRNQAKLAVKDEYNFSFLEIEQSIMKVRLNLGC
jgi:predicted nuclease of restriction endonuclease-like (RecB) superfamily